jgi:hypothetical protein
MPIERQTIFDVQGLIIVRALPERHPAPPNLNWWQPWDARHATGWLPVSRVARRYKIGTARCSLSSRSVREVEPKVTRTPIDVHAAFSKNVATNQNVIGREVIEHGKVTDELNPILEPN